MCYRDEETLSIIIRGMRIFASCKLLCCVFCVVLLVHALSIVHNMYRIFLIISTWTWLLIWFILYLKTVVWDTTRRHMLLAVSYFIIMALSLFLPSHDSMASQPHILNYHFLKQILPSLLHQENPWHRASSLVVVLGKLVHHIEPWTEQNRTRKVSVYTNTSATLYHRRRHFDQLQLHRPVNARPSRFSLDSTTIHIFLACSLNV